MRSWWAKIGEGARENGPGEPASRRFCLMVNIRKDWQRRLGDNTRFCTVASMVCAFLVFVPSTTHVDPQSLYQMSIVFAGGTSGETGSGEVMRR